MLDLHDPDGEEADQIADKLRPLAEERRAQVLTRVRQPDRQHEQGDGDREDAVCKGLESACLGHGTAEYRRPVKTER
jgi:hypothetical protein